MNVNEDIELPSNRRFGFFFTFCFVLTGAYFHSSGHAVAVGLCVTIATLFLVVSSFKPDVLLPLNKIWMRFGLIIGSVVSPIVLGLIFFGIITPVGILHRLAGRDELGLKAAAKQSYWIKVDQVDNERNSFKNQF